VRSRRILSLTEKHFGARCHPADTVTAGLGIIKSVESDYDLDHWPDLILSLQMGLCGSFGAAAGARHKVGSCARAISRVSGSGGPLLRADALGEQVQRSRPPPLPWSRFPHPPTQPLAASGEPLCAPARARAVAPSRLPAHDVTRACDDFGSAAHALFAVHLTLWLAGRWVETFCATAVHAGPLCEHMGSVCGPGLASALT